jgi:hypothetical protein
MIEKTKNVMLTSTAGEDKSGGSGIVRATRETKSLAPTSDGNIFSR